MRTPAAWSPLRTALWAGLTAGVLVALVDGIPLLTQGDIVGHARVRLQALAYLIVTYALLLGILMGALGLLLTVLLAVLRRPASRPTLLAVYTGLLAAAIALASWQHLHSRPNAPPAALLPVLGAASLPAGALAGLLAHAAARRWEAGPVQRRWLRRAVHWGPPTVVLLSALPLLLLGLYRNVLRPALPGPTAHTPATPERPNIVLITVDALRPDHLGAYGYDPAISPNIDALARRGAFFRQAIAQSSWTLPSVASMSTSMYPSELGVYSVRALRTEPRLDPLRTTLAEALQANGYRTAAFVTNVWVRQETYFDQGFDYFSGLRPSEAFDLDQLLRRPLLDLAWRCPFLHTIVWQSYYLLFDHRFVAPNDGLFVSIEAQSFLRQHRDERFFLWLYYLEPHDTYHPLSPFPSLPAGIGEEQLSRLQSLDFWALADGGSAAIPPEEIPALVSLYDGEIHDVDRWIGAVIDELDLLNLSDRTLIVLHSDHGEEFAEHGGFAHGSTFYDELARVPLIIAGPGVRPSGQGIDTPVALLDVLPTLLEAGGASPPAEAHGRSLWPLLRGEPMAEVPIYMETLHTTVYDQKAVRYQGWKLVYGLLDGQVELYDLRSDPREQHNLAGQEPGRAAEYLRLLQQWMAQTAQAAEALPRGLPPMEMDERMRSVLRQGGY